MSKSFKLTYIISVGLTVFLLLVALGIAYFGDPHTKYQEQVASGVFNAFWAGIGFCFGGYVGQNSSPPKR